MSLLNGPNNDCKWYAFINTRVSYVCVAYAFTYVHAHTRYLTVSYTGGDTFVNERKSMSNVSSRQHLTPIFLSSFCLWWDYVSPQTGKAIYVCEPILYSSSHTVTYYNCVYNYTILSSNTIQTIRSVSDCFFLCTVTCVMYSPEKFNKLLSLLYVNTFRGTLYLAWIKSCIQVDVVLLQLMFNFN